MKVDLVGKIKNTQLPRHKALLPMFETVVNAFQAIEDGAGSQSSGCIEIIVVRDPVLTGLDVDGHVNGFSVTDTGVGFDETNLDSFFTSDTQLKVGKGGKGLGRFSWLKAFDHAQVESHYRRNGTLVKRAFTFTTETDKPAGPPEASPATEPSTTVRLIGMRDPYKEHCPQGLELIGHQLIEHCLPFFIDPQCPKVTIADDRQTLDLNAYFRDTFAANATSHNFTVADRTFKMTGLRLYNPHAQQHRLLYAANFREVDADRLDRYLPNLQKARLEEDDGRKFVYLGFVEGQYLDDNVNSERTSFVFPREPSADGLLDEISLQAIREAALVGVRADLQPFLEEINAQKRETITAYITREAPEYRPLARYIDDFIDRIPPGASGRALEVALHEQMYERQKAIRQESHTLMEDSALQSLKPEEYEAKVNDFIERANELGKSSLAQYVIHRKVILDFLEKSLQSNPATGKYELEEVIHRFIYPMRASSVDVPYEQQNLWIIDERLAYHEYLASDLPLNTAEVLANPSESRPDIMIFDRALSFTEDQEVLGSLVIVEFKKPARSDYKKEDPVDQVYRLIREIKGGHFKDKNGREIKVQSGQIPAYAYVICDTTKEIEIIAQNKGMLPTPDNLGYYVYNPSLQAYVEIISYTKLLRDAKKRNRILFDKLHLPVSL